MSEKRYFYTDPLAAAWMAKHFEMKFDGISVSFTERSRGLPCIFEVYEISEQSRHAKGAIIHPDSLHFLEAQIGDLVLCEIDNMNHPEAEFQMVTYDPKLFDLRHGICRILVRNGIPFMWPESEEAWQS